VRAAGSSTVPSRRAGCPTSRSFFARCGIPPLRPLILDTSDAFSGQHPWYLTSREKRARCGAPGHREGTRVVPSAAKAGLFHNLTYGLKGLTLHKFRFSAAFFSPGKRVFKPAEAIGYRLLLNPAPLTVTLPRFARFPRILAGIRRKGVFFFGGHHTAASPASASNCRWLTWK
jgi:hypothetical protein